MNPVEEFYRELTGHYEIRSILDIGCSYSGVFDTWRWIAKGLKYALAVDIYAIPRIPAQLDFI